jgi:hypothetical protein
MTAPPPPPAPVPPPPPSLEEISLQDFSALPICSTVGATATFGGASWTIDAAPSFKVRRNGQWIQGGDGQGPHGYMFITTSAALYVVGANGSVYQNVGDGWQRVDTPTMGCRLPPSASGSTVLQQNGVLVDNQGGIWMATCSYFKFTTYCPDFIGTTIEEGIILRNGARFPDPGIRSQPEGSNAPWNLKWCGGQMYIHTYPTTGEFGRWQGLANPTTLAPATVNDCG